MNTKGRIINENTGEEMTRAEMQAMHENVKTQVESPGRRKKEHIRLSDIWNTQSIIRKIQRQLVEGYSFDKGALTALVNTMFGFINGIVKPDANVSCEEVIDDITAE